MSKIGFVGDKMRFSERYGYQPIREIIQKNSINTDLKNALWNTIIVCIFNKYSYHFGARSRPIIGSNLESFFQLLFHSFFKKKTSCVSQILSSRKLYFMRF